MKIILIIFFDIKVIVHFEFIPQDETDKQAYCMEILKHLVEAVCRKMPELRPSNWILYHDNAPAYKALCVKQFVAQNRFLNGTPALFPHLVLNDLWLFPKIKSASKGRRFQDTEDI
jgi:hypothetical protein